MLSLSALYSFIILWSSQMLPPVLTIHNSAPTIKLLLCRRLDINETPIVMEARISPFFAAELHLPCEYSIVCLIICLCGKDR